MNKASGEAEMTEPAALGSEATAYKLTLTGAGVEVNKEVDGATAMKIVALALGTDMPTGVQPRATTTTSKRRGAKRTKAPGEAGAKRSRRKGSHAVVKDLSLRPEGRTAFLDFANEKQPKTHQQKQAVAVVWLRDEAGLASGITADHVNTCYVEAGWPRPADLSNNLQVTAGQKGWLDTRDMTNIKITTRGEDEVRHNLPKTAKGRTR
jgi:hypothetical protein